MLGPALEAQGAGKVVFGNHDCNITAVVSEPPNIATRFRLEGVTHVLIVSNFAAAQIFMTTAKSQGYAPKYSTSDWFLNTSDATTANFPPDQFDGAIGIASLGPMLRPVRARPPYDGWQQCSQIAVDAGLAPIPPDDSRLGRAAQPVRQLRPVPRRAASRAGPNPTRASWRAAVAHTGAAHEPRLRSRAASGPASSPAPTPCTPITWQRGCRCWRSISDFRPAAA